MPAQIAALVEAGRLTPLEGKARLEVHRRMTEEKEKAQREAAAREEIESRANSELETKIEAVNTAVRENRLSREDGFAQIQELRNEATRSKIQRDEANRLEAERKSFQGRLDAAVKAGQLTKAQAAKRLEAYDKRKEL